MAKVNGQIVTCDRCGKEIFRKCTGEGERDGGYARWNNFEPLPDGWGMVEAPKAFGTAANKSFLQVCPECRESWNAAVESWSAAVRRWFEMVNNKEDA